jgi:hypothetical protein
MSSKRTKRNGTVAMLSSVTRALSLGLGLVVLGGCGNIDEETAAWDSEEEELGTAEQEIISYNDISPEVLRLKLLAGVAATKLCINTNDPNYCEITGTWDTWQNATYPVEKGQMLKAMVRCAMPAGYQVYVPGYGGGTFVGQAGLLPGWRTSSLTNAQQEIMSGCVLAHINAYGVQVEIGILGPFDTAPLPSGFKYMEAIFYGNLFWAGPAYIACGGIQEDGGDRVVGRNKRVCGEAGNPCRIDAIGACNGTYSQGSTGYCVQWQGSGDGKYCAVARDDGAKQWNYPSTVYLKTEPLLVSGPLYRCGASGSEWCTPEY